MGRREWGFLIKNKDDLKHVLELINEHNSDGNIGEELELGCIFKYKKKMYLCIANGGGGADTTDFIVENYTGPLCYYPFDKPKWWLDMDKQEILWKADSKKSPESVFE